MLTIISWNINQSEEAWRDLASRNDVDIALLQEAKLPPTDLHSKIEVDREPPWETAGANSCREWRAAVVRVSDRVRMRSIPTADISQAGTAELAVSRNGTLAVAEVTVLDSGESILVASMYGAWEAPMAEIESSWIYADASVHRIISDLSALIGRQRGHGIIAAGDLNILRGYGEGGSTYWRDRYQTVFDRMRTIGLEFVGPMAPDGGLPAIVRPEELPHDNTTIPTFRTNRTQPESATRQLDFVFASADLAPRVQVRAANRPDNWGSSDHCQIEIEFR